MYGSIRRIPGEMDKNCCIVFSFKARPLQAGRDGLVGYDAALTQLRSGVRFPLFVFVFGPRASLLLLLYIITSSKKQ